MGLAEVLLQVIQGMPLPILLMTVAVFGIVFIKDRAWIKLTMMLSGAFVLFLSMRLASRALSGSNVNSSGDVSSGGISPSSDENSAVETSTGSASADGDMFVGLLIVLGGLVGIVFLIGLVSFVVTVVRRRTMKSNLESENRKRSSLAWAQVRERHQQGINTVAKYETDIALAIEYPAMNDVSVDKTSEMIQAMKAANDMWETFAPCKKQSKYSIYGNDEALKSYESIVSSFDAKIAIAERNARQIEWSKLSVAEQKDLKTAKFLLSHASDPGNTEDMRYNYLKRLGDVVKRVNERHRANVLPEVSLQVIENETRLLLTAGEGGAESLVDNDFFGNMTSRGSARAMKG